MKKTIKKDKILKWTTVLFIATAMVMSTTAVPADISQVSVEKVRQRNGTISDDWVTLLEEGFEDPWVPDSDGDLAPPGWEVKIYNLAYYWHPVTEVGPTGDPVYEGTYAAQVDRDSSHKDEWLTTPEIELPEFMYSNVSLNFWAHSMTLQTGATVKVVIKGDGFQDVIWDMIKDEVWIPPPLEWKEKILDLTSYIGETITISWQYVGGMCYNFALDEVIVRAKFAADPAVLKIGTISGGLLRVNAEIKNVGLGNTTDVEWTILITGNLAFRKINETTNGTIPTLYAGGLEKVRSDPIWGLGKINITVSAYEPVFQSSDTKSVDGFIFLIFVIVPAN